MPGTLNGVGDTTNYPSNSHKSKAEKKAVEERAKVEKVVTGTAKARKKSEISKLSDVFIAEDIGNVKNYILKDVLVPAVKKAIVDIVTDGVNMIFFGGTNRGKGSGNTPYVSYRDYSKNSSSNTSTNYASSSRFDISEIVFETRGDAESVLDQMGAMLEKYSIVSVADVYDMAELPHPYTSNKYGWTHIRGADVSRLVGGGYVIKLPRPMPLD